jgi:hypothetical protein
MPVHGDSGASLKCRKKWKKPVSGKRINLDTLPDRQSASELDVNLASLVAERRRRRLQQ